MIQNNANEAFKIYVDQLRNGHVEELNEALTPDFLDIQDKELSYTAIVDVSGEAYLAEHELVLHLDIETEAAVVCPICNEPVKVPISIQGFYHTVPLEEIKTGIYLYDTILRETILVETPRFAECEGSCPRRQEIQKYLRKEGAQGDPNPPQDGQRPFAHLK